MECDWEVEIGEGAPVMDATWAGYVDLRDAPECAGELAEVVAFPALGPVLQQLNSSASPVATSKCDFWPSLAPEEVDADEMDAAAECSNFAAGCYIDLLPHAHPPLSLEQAIETLCKPWCARLRGTPLRECRADFVVRRAVVRQVAAPAPEPARTGSIVGITAYVTACGAASADALGTLGSALGALADAIQAASTLQ